MAKIEKEYEGKAAIVFIDVWKHNEQARRFGIRAIPTQIFYNEERPRKPTVMSDSWMKRQLSTS